MNSAINITTGTPHWVMGEQAEVLAGIYNEAINIALWQRDLCSDIHIYVDQLLKTNKTIAIKLAASPAQLMNEIQGIFPPVLFTENNIGVSATAFYADVHLMVDMFACLFDTTAIGLRINTLERAMCPRFHKDNVGVRLVTTYAGPGTEWLSATVAHSSNDAPGLMNESKESYPYDAAAVQTTAAGTVALLKGEMWEGNEGRGIVHRSPDVSTLNMRRLLMTCDLL